MKQCNKKTDRLCLEKSQEQFDQERARLFGPRGSQKKQAGARRVRMGSGTFERPMAQTSLRKLGPTDV